MTKHSAVIRISKRAFIIVEWRGVRKTRGVIFPAGLVEDYQFVTILQHLCQYRDEFVTKVGSASVFGGFFSLNLCKS